MSRSMLSSLILVLSCFCMTILPISAFVPTANKASVHGPTTLAKDIARNNNNNSPFEKTIHSTTTLKVYNDEEEKEQIEEARVRIWKSRREEIRGMLKSAEKIRNFRLSNGYVPELDKDGNAIKSDGKSAVTLTAFAVTAGAIILRVGGRAALVSAVGLDFLSDNPDMQNQINQVLSVADGIDPFLKAGLFCLGWTFVKTLCFDAGGIALAFASGILFGGVIQGAVMSAFGATVGSSVAFALAKADTPVRKKAIEVVEENPSLRGLEKVVADEGLKAVLTLRLAPVLPIPLGMYNYVYGISNVKFTDFAGGIFLGSLKPYFLDSYLGYFGKSLVDGTANDGGMQDYLLIGVLGVSVLIGVFASQLASETWDAVQREEEKEQRAKKLEEGNIEKDEDEGITKEIFGIELPQWLVGFQYALQDADERMNELVLKEFDAKVWNCTEGSTWYGYDPTKSNLPDSRNPALIDLTSPELTEKYQGVDFGATTCDGLVLSPVLFSYFLKFADPLFDEAKFLKERDEDEALKALTQPTTSETEVPIQMESSSEPSTSEASAPEAERAAATIALASMILDEESPTTPNVAATPKAPVKNEPSAGFKEGVFLNQLQELKDQQQQRLEKVNKKLDELNSDS